MLCEILAMKLLGHFASNHIQLVAVLTTRWNPLAGATSEIVDEVNLAVGGNEDQLDSAQSALEVRGFQRNLSCHSTEMTDGDLDQSQSSSRITRVPKSCE
ncbi:hypothetical protein C0991_010660 [Blastosporella zonata]|nr:hypothetical protein C0991_010660 [Blastosporella zonata]